MTDDTRQDIQKRLIEIDAYRSHSLYKEARIRCRELASIIKSATHLPEQNQLLTRLSRMVKEIDEGARAFDAISGTVKMSTREQQLVRRLFSGGKRGRGAGDFEHATVMLVFGQHGAALEAFHKLLDIDAHRVAAAKSIIRCHLGDDHLKRAVNQYLIWHKNETFPPVQLEDVRVFLQALMEKKGLNMQLPKPMIKAEEVALDRTPETTSPDFLSVVLPYADQRMRMKQVMLDVNFQRGARINCIVPAAESAFTAFMRKGMIFPNVQVNATDMISFCSVRLLEAGEITGGRHKGDATITLEVLNE